MKELKIFLASPSDVEKERKDFSEVVSSINRSIANKIGLRLEPILWEKHAYPEANNPQKVINKLLEDADLVIVVFWNKFGAPTTQFPSGTMEEFTLAYEKKQNTGKPSIKIYFREPTQLKTTSDIDEFKKVLEFKESIKEKALYKEYDSAETFKALLTEHINSWLLSFSKQPKDKNETNYEDKVIKEPLDAKNIVRNIFKNIENLYDTGYQPTYDFGLKNLDHLVGFVETVNFMLIAGCEDTGKTSLAMTLAKNAAIINKNVLYFSFRNSESEIMLRMMSNLANVDSHKFRNGLLEDHDWPPLTRAAGQISEMPLFIDDNPSLKTSEIKEQVHRFMSSHDLDLIVLDGLNYVASDMKTLGYDLRILSKEIDIPIVGTLQIQPINRGADKRPILEDLNKYDVRSEVDIVLFLHRMGEYGFYDSYDLHNGVELIIAKHVAGSVNSTAVNFTPAYYKFEEPQTLDSVNK